ncbi:MAG: transporter [Hyphomicrobiales bacterium]|nr:transporter [Hyphomicrobiales bacterium]
MHLKTAAIKTFALALGVAMGALAAPAIAQTYPDKPIQVVVPWPPGAVDLYVRTVQASVEKALGKPLLIVNRGGANGALGMESVARAKPDGYTLLFNVTSSAVMAPLTSPNVNFDVQKDFMPITDVFFSPVILVVRKSLPVSNLEELIAYGRKNQGKLNFGSPGSGSALHLIGESFAKASGIQMTHVPYRGFAPEVQALLGDELDMGFIATGTILQHVTSGAVKAIAMAEGDPAADLPKVPDLTKALPGFENIPIFAGLWAPAGTPTDIVQQLNKVFSEAIKTPENRNKIAEGGQIPLGRSIAETTKAVAQNVDVATRLVTQAKAAGVKFD